jgi:hypothetical protein
LCDTRWILRSSSRSVGLAAGSWERIGHLLDSADVDQGLHRVNGAFELLSWVAKSHYPKATHASAKVKIRIRVSSFIPCSIRVYVLPKVHGAQQQMRSWSGVRRKVLHGTGTYDTCGSALIPAIPMGSTGTDSCGVYYWQDGKTNMRSCSQGPGSGRT